MNRFEGKVAIVTGGASGIGESIARRFIEEGGKVVLVDINVQNLKSLANELNKKVSGSCLPLTCDVTDESVVKNVIDTAWNEFGNVDILVNNAGGSMNHTIHLLDVTVKMWDQIFDLNTKSVFLFAKAFIGKHRMEKTKGNIVNMASQSGIVPNESMRPHYSAAKAAVIGLTKHMSREFGPDGFRVNAVAPGYCMSGERIEKLWESRDTEAILRNVPLKRTSTTNEQAAAVLFLSSDDATYITGVILDVTGGGF